MKIPNHLKAEVDQFQRELENMPVNGREEVLRIYLSTMYDVIQCDESAKDIPVKVRESFNYAPVFWRNHKLFKKYFKVDSKSNDIYIRNEAAISKWKRENKPLINSITKVSCTSNKNIPNFYKVDYYDNSGPLSKIKYFLQYLWIFGKKDVDTYKPRVFN